VASSSFKNYVVVLISLVFLITATSNVWVRLPCTPQCSDRHDAEKAEYPLKTSHDYKALSIATNQQQAVCYNCVELYNTILTLVIFINHIEVNSVILSFSVDEMIAPAHNHIPDPYRTPPA